MKNHLCPHLSECKQFIFKHDFEWKCLGKISWNQENCFRLNAIGTKELHELPMMWWAKELLKRWKESKKEKENLRARAPPGNGWKNKRNRY